MSTISTVGGPSTDLLSLYQLLQQLRSNSSSSATGKAKDTDGDNDGSTTGQTSDAGSTTAVSSVNPTDLKSQIDAAVSAAIKNQSPSGSVTDLLQSIRSAIDNTLKQNGIDPKQLHHGHHAQPGGQNLSQFQSQFESLLKQNGIDPQTFEQQLAAETNSPTSDASAATSTAASNPLATTGLLATLFPQPSLNVTA